MDSWGELYKYFASAVEEEVDYDSSEFIFEDEEEANA